MDNFPQPVEIDPVQDYLNELAKWTIQTPPVACGRSYVLVSKMAEWWKSTTKVRGESTTQATRLLQHVYSNWGYSIPVDKDKLLGSEPCVIIFSILLKIGRGGLIHKFCRVQQLDKNLPFTNLDTLRALFSRPAPEPRGQTEILNPDELAEAFFKEQWQFCPVQVGSAHFCEYENHKIIPIHRMELITEKGGTAKLWQIEVLKEFVHGKLQQAVSTSEYTPVDHDGLGPRYHFALKVFNEGFAAMFENEIDSFKALQGQSGVVRYLGAYSHNQKNCILLEYGDRDLDEVFFGSLPPVLRNEVEDFWKHLFEVSDALSQIHNLDINNDGLSRQYYGWHADIKPDNILEIEGRFKLADPGFAKFLERGKGDFNAAPTAGLSGGTYSYGAPELHSVAKGAGTASQTIDIWSLGCVFSVAATWISLGHQGIKQYSELRKRAIGRLVEKQEQTRLLSSSPPRGPDLDRGDYFHDGSNVLPEVVEWHKALRGLLRNTDRITSLVLDLVDSHMLVGDPSLRIDSTKLCKELSNIFQGLGESSTSVPDSIVGFLKDLDMESSSNTSREEIVTLKLPSHSTFEDRQKRKSECFKSPLIPTMHRSNRKPTLTAFSPHDGSRRSFPNGRESLDVSPSAVHVPPISNPTVQEEPQSRESTNTHPTPTPNPAPFPTPAPAPTAQSQRPQSMASGSLPSPVPKVPIENIFQAHEASKRNKKSFWSRRVRKDELLDNYFKNRDIKFLVDNADSMAQHWAEVKFLLKILLKKVEGLDDDGVDLSFTQSTHNVQNTKGIAKIMEKMREVNPIHGVSTDIIDPLQKILSDYRMMVEHGPKLAKNMTIIVLTDGIWENTLDKDGVGRTIISFVQQPRSQMHFTHRPVSIEFIQFGHDPDATLRLKELDNNLVQDLVDTEPSDGNVNKMLLGSFVPIIDNYDLSPIVQATSPRESPYTTVSQINGSSSPSLYSTILPSSQPGSPPFDQNSASPMANYHSHPQLVGEVVHPDATREDERQSAAESTISRWQARSPLSLLCCGLTPSLRNFLSPSA